MSKEKDVLFGVLTKAFVKSEDEINNIVYTPNGEIREDALDALLNADAERVKRIKKDAEDAAFNKGFSKAKGETLTDLENKFKEKFSFNSDAKGLDLFEEFAVKAQKTSVNIDDVRKHPAYLELEKSSIRKSEYDKLLSDYDTFKKNLEREKVMSKVSTKALDILEKLNPVIEENPTVAKKRKDIFLQEFNSFDYEFDGVDYIIPLKEGKRVQDKHGNAIAFETLVREAAEQNFVLNKQQYRQSAGNDGGSNGKVYVDVPRTKQEYLQALSKELDPKKRVALKEAYESVQAKL